MSFADETSVQDSTPIELYTITTPAGSTYLTSSERDLQFAGVTWQATQVRRGNVENVQIGRVRSLDIELSVDHPLTQLLLRGGIPPKDASVTVYRIHESMIGLTSGQLQMWRGSMGQISVSGGGKATINVPSRVDRLFQIRLPMPVAQRLCQHMLYDRGCNTPSQFAICTVADVDIAAETIQLTAYGQPDFDGIGYATYGMVLRVLNGESRSILSQSGVNLSIDVSYPDLQIGETLLVFAGCDHRPTTCRYKFSNMRRFGGHPQFPTNNPSKPTGSGVSVQQS
ncbi:MAG: phage BR0599 family protein [Rhodoglobus sp.]